GLAGVAGQVQERLLELPAVRQDRPASRLDLNGHLDRAGELALQHRHRVPDKLPRVEDLLLAGAALAEGQELIRHLGAVPRRPLNLAQLRGDFVETPAQVRTRWGGEGVRG